MKKIIIIAAIALGFSISVSAQPRAAGLRLGASGMEISYQQDFTKNQFIQGELGADFGSPAGIKATATYNFLFARPAWTNRGYWGMYAGPGLSMGYVQNSFMFSVVAQAGIEYTFWFPLQLSADLRPCFGTLGGNFYNRGMIGFVPTISARYRF